MNALVFGANGQDGFYLAESLRARGIECVGVDRYGDMRHGDVADYAFVHQIIGEQKPSYIFHLAARSTTHHDGLFDNHAAISTGSLNILEAVHRERLPARVLLCGSGVQFQNYGAPISEETPFAATSPYAVARIHAVFAARYYRTLGVQAYVAYLFHHESPKRPADHLTQRIARAAQRIHNGSSEVLDIGDLSVEKEWTFAGDVVKGMLILLEQDATFEAVIGSGETHSIQEWVNTCFGLLGLDWTNYVRQREGFVPEYSRLCSNPARIFAMGWRPAVSFTELAAMMMHS